MTIELSAEETAKFGIYNSERPHKSLGNQTSDVVHRTAIGGGALIVDKFGGAGGETPAPLRSTGVSPPAEARAQSKATAKPGQRRPAASEIRGTA
jgi:putative transposase